MRLQEKTNQEKQKRQEKEEGFDLYSRIHLSSSVFALGENAALAFSCQHICRSVLKSGCVCDIGIECSPDNKKPIFKITERNCGERTMEEFQKQKKKEDVRAKLPVAPFAFLHCEFSDSFVKIKKFVASSH